MSRGYNRNPSYPIIDCDGFRIVLLFYPAYHLSKSQERISMLAIKQEALRTINALPDDTDIEEIMYRLYIVNKIRKGQQAIEQKQVLSSDELKQEIETWVLDGSGKDGFT